MRFYDVKKERGYAPVIDAQRKRLLFLPLSYGWRFSNLSDIFSSLDRNAGYALRSEKTQKFHTTIGGFMAGLFKLLTSPQKVQIMGR